MDSSPTPHSVNTERPVITMVQQARAVLIQTWWRATRRPEKLNLLRDSATVWAGIFNELHRQPSLDTAIKQIQNTPVINATKHFLAHIPKSRAITRIRDRHLRSTRCFLSGLLMAVGAPLSVAPASSRASHESPPPCRPRSSDSPH